MLLEECTIDRDRTRCAVVDPQQRIREIIDVDDLVQALVTGPTQAMGVAQKDCVHFAGQQGVDLEARPGRPSWVVAPERTLSTRRRQVDQGDVVDAVTGERERRHVAVEGSSALKVDQVPVQRQAESLASQVAYPCDAASLASQDSLVFIEPGDAHDHGFAATRSCPDGRNVPALAKEASELVVVVGVLDRGLFGVAQGMEHGARTGRTRPAASACEWRSPMPWPIRSASTRARRDFSCRCQTERVTPSEMSKQSREPPGYVGAQQPTRTHPGLPWRPTAV